MRLYQWYDTPLDLLSGSFIWLINNPVYAIIFIFLGLFMITPQGPSVKEKSSRDAFPNGVDGEAF